MEWFVEWGQRKGSRSVLEKDDQKMGNKVKLCDQVLSGVPVGQLVRGHHSLEYGNKLNLFQLLIAFFPIQSFCFQ